MAANFDSYLDVDVESIERPTPPPIGHWFASISGYKTQERNYGEGKEKTPVCELSFKLTGADDDAVASAEETGVDPQAYINRTVTRDYTLNEEGGVYGLRQVGEAAAKVDVKGLKLRDMLNALKGHDVKLYIDHRMGKPGSAQEGQAFANVTKVLAVDA